MKHSASTLILGMLLALITGTSLTSLAIGQSTPSPVWTVVYSHDADGQRLSGSKSALIEAVREGQAIRLYWAGKRVEHSTDAFFLTILGGEVFAQIESIQGQASSIDPPAIALRESPWRAIFSTHGDRALKWFAQQ